MIRFMIAAQWHRLRRRTREGVLRLRTLVLAVTIAATTAPPALCHTPLANGIER